MTSVVIDTNVLVVANCRSSHAGPECVLKTIERLQRVRDGEVIALDSLGLILDEYIQQRLAFSGQPGAGDAFFRWLYDNQANEQRVERVQISQTDDGRFFQEFPKDSRLSTFDPSDRKFVAVALACVLNPSVLNAVDSDWWDYRAALNENGVRIEFLCPQQFEGHE